MMMPIIYWHHLCDYPFAAPFLSVLVVQVLNYASALPGMSILQQVREELVKKYVVGCSSVEGISQKICWINAGSFLVQLPISATRLDSATRLTLEAWRLTSVALLASEARGLGSPWRPDSEALLAS